MGTKVDPSVEYGGTSAPRKAYDCCVASACTPASLYVEIRTATETVVSMPTRGESVAVNTPPAHTPLTSTPTAVVCKREPTDTVAPAFAVSPNSKCTCVLGSHATGEFASLISGALAVIKPPAPKTMLTDSTCDGVAIARKRYFFATVFKRYCASADVGHGFPYAAPKPAAHCVTANAGLR